MSVAEYVRPRPPYVDPAGARHRPLPNVFARIHRAVAAVGPDMDANEPDGDHRLDVREIEGEPFGDIMAALESLDEDETLVLVADFDPVPLYDVLESRGFTHDTAQVADDEFHVAIEAA